jgi:uncharacterized protein (TIGR00269 family)
MKCEQCEEKAVFTNPSLCKDHFIAHIHEKVSDCIQKYPLCTKYDKVCVAVSGGKDSVSLLVILSELGYNVSGLAIDEGIKGYRPQTLEDLKKICKEKSIPLHIVSFKEAFGKDLDDIVENRHPCSVCGVFRRYLLNTHAKDFDVIATGHNLDDEAQAVLMNLTKGNTDLLLRTHVRTPDQEGFVPRIKPFAFITEKEILAYAVLREFPLHFTECPYVPESLRDQIRSVLNERARHNPALKRELFEAGLYHSEKNKGRIHNIFCEKCGQPASSATCRACSLKEEISKE